MESHCIPFGEVPHTTALFHDFLCHFSRVSSFYSYDPFEPNSFSAAAEAITLDPEQRRAVADVLAEQNGRFGADEKTLENIGRLRDGRVRVVVAGQQVGLFGGPAYSIYKALTAVLLAERLTAEGTPSIPVFWLASEDHDFAEVKHTALLGADSRLRKLRYSATTEVDVPVGQITFTSSVIPLKEQAVGLWASEIREEGRRYLGGYVPEQTYATAFGHMLQRVFAGKGLVVLDPLHPTLHALSRPLFRRALEEAEPIQDMLRRRDRELEQAGYHVQVRLRDDATLLFLQVDGRRLPVRRRAGEFFLPGKGKRSLDELLEELSATPENVSANVLLRPVIQDWLLPTVAYIVGPAEVAYCAQSSVLYQHLLGRMPVVAPRVSMTLVEPKVGRLLKKYKLHLTHVFQGRNRLRTRLAERRLPGRLQRRLASAEAKLEKLLAQTTQEVGKLDATLEGAAESSRRKMLYQFGKIRRKAARAQAERSAIVDRHTDQLLNALYPNRQLQEREVNFLSFLARQGPELVDRLLEQACFPCRDHQVIFL